MKTRFRLIRRGLRGGAFYCVDRQTGKRASAWTLSGVWARKHSPKVDLLEHGPA
jgi:hypothetical protein